MSIDFRNDRASFAGVGARAGERAERVRRGEREPISPLVRQLVYRRDSWQCQHCGAFPNSRDPHRRSGALHLDHIVPWSAGGSDKSDNLRTLCGPCNYERSNFVDGSEKPAVPIVRMCLPCLTHSFIAAWVKPFAAFKRNVRIAYTWEPVLFRPGRDSSADGAPVGRDHLAEPITVRRGFTGAKPARFNRWVLDLLGYIDGDEVIDLFPGTGGMAETLDRAVLL